MTGELDAAVVCADTSETDGEVLRALLEVSRGGTTWPRLIGAADEASDEPERGEGALREDPEPVASAAGPEPTAAQPAQQPSVAAEFDGAAVSAIVEMGFSENAAKRGLRSSGHTTHLALEWIMSQPDGESLDRPLSPTPGDGATAAEEKTAREVEGCISLARALESTGNLPEAVDAYTQALSRCPRSLPLLCGRAELQLRMAREGASAQAEHCLQMALADAVAAEEFGEGGELRAKAAAALDALALATSGSDSWEEVDASACQTSVPTTAPLAPAYGRTFCFRAFVQGHFLMADACGHRAQAAHARVRGVREPAAPVHQAVLVPKRVGRGLPPLDAAPDGAQAVVNGGRQACGARRSVLAGPRLRVDRGGVAGGRGGGAR